MPSVRQQVAKPQALMRSQQNCSKQEERQYWTECVAIWETNEWSEEWTFSTFIPLRKKGDHEDPRWISKWITNCRANSHEPLLR